MAFLGWVTEPARLAPIDHQDSLSEITRVLLEPDYGFAIIAQHGEKVIGTLGIIQAKWWFNAQYSFFTDRWFFVDPAYHHLGVATMLQVQADLIARQSRIPLVINGKMRRKGHVYYTFPHTTLPAATEEKD